jgi:DNA ligase-1
MEETTNLLKRMKELTAELKLEEGTSWKTYVLGRYRDCRELLSIIYNPHINFYVTKKGISENFMGGHVAPNRKVTLNLLELLSWISKEEIPRGSLAYESIWYFINNHKEHEELIIDILDKDLGCGISEKTINEVWEGTIPSFSVPLAKNYQDHKGKIKFEEGYFISRKLDGIRTLAFIYSKDDIKIFSRKGKEIHTLGYIKEELSMRWKGPNKVVLDGELCLLEESGVESWNKVSEEIRRKDHTIVDPLFYVFDAYTIEEFLAKRSVRKFSFTYNILVSYLEGMHHIKCLQQHRVKDESTLEVFLKEKPAEWEGFMLRKDNPTQFKRSDTILKVKNFLEGEYEVIGLERGKKWMVDHERDCVGAILISHKDSLVGVGSGLTDKQRMDWIKNPSLIVGKKITVKYFEESYDKEGRVSLRFPVLKGIRDEED